jgi:hypothetical protein
MLCDEKLRLDVNGIKQHPFFEGIDWVNIRSTTAAIVPQLSGPSDTSCFDHFEEEFAITDKKKLSQEAELKKSTKWGVLEKLDRRFTHDFHFIGYPFTCFWFVVKFFLICKDTRSRVLMLWTPTRNLAQSPLFFEVCCFVSFSLFFFLSFRK